MITSKSKCKQMLLFFIMFLFVFGWKITSFLDIIFFISLFNILYIALKRIKIDSFIIKLVVFLVISVLYGMFIAILKGAFDLTFITRTIRAIVNTLGAFGLISIYKSVYAEKRNISDYILRDLEYVILLHAVIVVIMYLFPTARNIVYSLTNIIDWGASGSIKLGYRIAGLTYALSQTSVIQMWGILFLIHNFHNSNNKNFIFFIVKLFLLFVSVLVTGRTGLLFGIIFIPIYVLLINKIKLKVIFRYGLRIVLGLMILISVLFLFKNKIPSKFIDYTVVHANEIITLLTSGESGTLDALSHMYIAPENNIDFLFGTSSLGRSNEVYISSDVGFVKVLFAVGVIGSIIYYLCEITCIMSIFTRKRGNSVSLKYLTFFVVITNLLLNFKELAIYTRNQWSIIIIVVWLNYNKSRLTMSESYEVLDIE